MTEQWRRWHHRIDLPYATFCPQCTESWPCDVAIQSQGDHQ